jgi:hypothetical protein
VHVACVVALAGAVSAQDWCFAPSVEEADADPVITLLEDLDGDGSVDLVTANNGSNGVSVFLGQGDLTFGARADYATSPVPWDVASGDLNEDGVLDLVVGHDALGVISLLFGVGDGTFGPAVNLPIGSAPASVEVGLIDGDGHLDLAVRYDGPLTAILLGAGDGTFAQVGTITDSVSGTGINLSLALTDVNADGLLDHVSVGPQASGFLVRLGAGDGTFGPQASFGVPIVQSVYLTVADLNGDGNPDLISREFTGAIGIGYGLGDGTFVTATIPPVQGALQPAGNLAVADLDLDGDLDIAIGGGAVASDIVALYPNNGNGTFAPPLLQELPVAFTGTNTNGAYGTTAGDLDGDGRPELVVSHRGSSPPGVNLSILGNLSSDACEPWSGLGGGVSGGSSGTPLLVGVGPLTAGSPFAVTLFRGEPASDSYFVYGTTALLAPFKGGTLVPNPLAVELALVSADGTVGFDGTWPPGLPSGLDFYLQHWVEDAGAPVGFAGSNGLQGTTP